MIRLDKIGARQAICEAYGIHLTTKGFDVLDQCSGTGQSNNSALICDAVQAGKVISVISSLPAHIQAWALWVYGPRVPSLELPAQGALFQWLHDDVSIKLLESERRWHVNTANKIRDLVAHTVIDYRHHACTGEHLYTTAEIKKRCGILRQNWQRDYEEWHEYYCSVCDSLDRKALLPLSKLLLEEKKKQERNWCQGVYVGQVYVEAGVLSV